MARRALPLAALLPLLAAGCSLTRVPDVATPLPVPLPGVEAPRAPLAPGARLLGIAERFVGAPYRYGGDAPGEGFDCSGLVLRVHELAGLAVPRTAQAQHAAAQPVPGSALQPGDLVFFASRRGTIDHVGIYAGDGRFLHAPRRGRPVGYDRLDDDWFAARFVGAGRFWTEPAPVPAAPAVP
ncbi:MAG: NlpC/P60 family protein [Steroidobacteraceae bacterium]|jgi:cell wall-associated NlpC family hydrolase|nr:NlpC/P60 family protein [Steroidobacteraceae bacterium]